MLCECTRPVGMRRVANQRVCDHCFWLDGERRVMESKRSAAMRCSA